MAFTIGSLFSGIGGLELGLEMAGLGPVVWQVEQDRFCQAVLARHWPEARRFHDVRTVGAARLARVDVVCGGFPCQGLSVAGRRRGFDDPRSGLWREFARIVRELLPRFVVVENVARLATRGLDVVVHDLERAGYRVEGRIVAASDVGAPHRRERLFLVAYANGLGQQGLAARHGAHEGLEEPPGGDAPRRRHPGGSGPLADADRERIRLEPERLQSNEAERGDAEPLHARPPGGGASQSGVGRCADGVSRGLDVRFPALPGQRQHAWEPARALSGVVRRHPRLRALGNAVVPLVAAVAGQRIVELAGG